MPCERFELDTKDGGKAVGFICTRGRKRWCKCGKPATRLCDYPKPSKKKRDKTCDVAMCVDCACKVADDRDLCAEHAKLVRAAGWPAELLADPHPHAMQVVKDIVETQELTKPCVAGDGAAALANLEHSLPKEFRPRDLDDWNEFVGERAAIFEYLGERPRSIAESLARELAGPAPRYATNGPLFAGAR
jgi:hypothetical protein